MSPLPKHCPSAFRSCSGYYTNNNPVSPEQQDTNHLLLSWNPDRGVLDRQCSASTHCVKTTHLLANFATMVEQTPESIDIISPLVEQLIQGLATGVEVIFTHLEETPAIQALSHSMLQGTASTSSGSQTPQVGTLPAKSKLPGSRGC
jgi:hypothetical protein